MSRQLSHGNAGLSRAPSFTMLCRVIETRHNGDRMPRPLKLGFSPLALLFLLLTSSALHAQTTTQDQPGVEPPATASSDERALAREQYQAGVEAYREGRYKDAIDLFLKADSLAPSAALSYNTARAYEHLGDAANALRWYRDYLRRAPDAEDRESVEQIVRDQAELLRNKGIQQVTVLSDPVGATVLIDGVPRGVTPWTGELTPGDHEAALRLRGYSDTTRNFTLSPDTPLDVSLGLEPAPDEPQPTPAIAAQPPRPADPIPADAAPTEHTSLTPYWVTCFGAGAAALGGALAFELLRGKAETEARDAPVQTDAAEQVDLMDDRKRMARILTGVGGGLVLAGGVLLTVDLARSKTQVSAACSPDGCSAVARGHF